MNVVKFPGWQKACADALLESDPQRVAQRVVAAETTIFVRLQELTHTPENFELEAIDAMLGELRHRIASSTPSETPQQQNSKAAAAKF